MASPPYEEHRAVTRLLAIVERLHDAVAARDAGRVRTVIDEAGAAAIPREVREEALLVAALPAASLRAPVQLLRFHHRLTQLAWPEREPAGMRSDAHADLREERPAAADAEWPIARGAEGEAVAHDRDAAQLEIPFGRRRGGWRFDARRGGPGGPPRDRV